MMFECVSSIFSVMDVLIVLKVVDGYGLWFSIVYFMLWKICVVVRLICLVLMIFIVLLCNVWLSRLLSMKLLLCIWLYV